MSRRKGGRVPRRGMNPALRELRQRIGGQTQQRSVQQTRAQFEADVDRYKKITRLLRHTDVVA